jgi:HSP20 family molecular chaperone IbpA
MNDRTDLAERAPESGTAVAARAGTSATSTSSTRQARIAPAVDVFEDRHGITLYADLPGVPREKLDIRVQDGNLYIEGEAVVPTPDALRLQHAEIRAPHFARAFTLGADFDVSRIDAQLRDGVLRLTIARRDEAKPRRIEVSVG